MHALWSPRCPSSDFTGKVDKEFSVFIGFEQEGDSSRFLPVLKLPELQGMSRPIFPVVLGLIFNDKCEAVDASKDIRMASCDPSFFDDEFNVRP